MRAPISVIIPTLNAASGLPACLGALGEGLEAGLIRELIISDGGSTDDTLRIADAAGALIIEGAPSRGGQMRRGAFAAQGRWLLFLHADTVLEAGWGQAVLDAIADGSHAYYFDLAFDIDGLRPRFVARWANWRSRRFHLPYGDQGLLISRYMYDEVGGHPDQPLMEDVALAHALGPRLVTLSATAMTSAEKYQRQGWFRRGMRNLWTLLRYYAGASADDLASSYRR